ncbi:Homeobox-like_domain superfamily [Hexamita inflata]|uniref:Homeobox-like domain superfamily n=1 Tax=Hexamita inflata TaxID=28002 RepID=A0AA86U560_9EUKA|nr:Homeobox-like domain superfamily [Hexamita inflata]
MLLQAIHECNHNILQLEYKLNEAQRIRWTQQEDALLKYSCDVFHNDLNKIAGLIMSKTKKQIYFRVLYLNKHDQCKIKQK